MVTFLKCAKCAKIVEIIQKSGCPTMCCSQAMVELKANTTDGAVEKHVPVVTVNGTTVTVKVGSAEHPMADDHWIQFVTLETTAGTQRKILNPGQAPEAVFALPEGEKAVAAYEFCNKHGLWKAEL